MQINPFAIIVCVKLSSHVCAKDYVVWLRGSSWESMATNAEEKIDANVDTEFMGAAPPTDGQHDTSDTGNVQTGGISWRTRLVNLFRLLLHLVCLGYSLYLIWLLAHLKDNNNYWFLSFIPIGVNLSLIMHRFLHKVRRIDHFPGIGEGTSIYPQPSYGAVAILMIGFPILTRQAYYHRQPDEFIGPRFIIISLQASIILILLDFVLEKVGKQESLLDYKDALTRMLLDFVDIFNMVEVLSVNVCVGVGSHVSEDSSTERAIQAFCTMSFAIVLYGQDTMSEMMSEMILQREGKPREDEAGQAFSDTQYSLITRFSFLLQNIPFLVIRIVVWARYNLYNLGFLMKNVTVIVLFIAILHKNGFRATFFFPANPLRRVQITAKTSTTWISRGIFVLQNTG